MRDPGTDAPGETILDPWLDDPFPDYDIEPVMAFSARTGDQVSGRQGAAAAERARCCEAGFTRASTSTADAGCSREREDMQRLARYIIRNPFSVEEMREASRVGLRHPDPSSTAPA